MTSDMPARVASDLDMPSPVHFNLAGKSWVGQTVECTVTWIPAAERKHRTEGPATDGPTAGR